MSRRCTPQSPPRVFVRDTQKGDRAECPHVPASLPVAELLIGPHRTLLCPQRLCFQNQPTRPRPLRPPRSEGEDTQMQIPSAGRVPRTCRLLASSLDLPVTSDTGTKVSTPALHPQPLKARQRRPRPGWDTRAEPCP